MASAINAQSLLNQIIVNGPVAKEYKLIDSICTKSPELLEKHKLLFPFLNSNKSIMGHIKNKPYGYAGDFEIIDRIYTSKVSKEYTRWDQYSLQNSAAKAVINRKQYFIDKLISCTAGTDISLLNLASGPARDLFELYEKLAEPSRLKTTCIDMDENAISYASNITEKYSDHIEFVQKNVLRYTTENKYDIIWSAGLFDYFDDKTFLFLLKRMKSWMSEKGKIIIGNFNEECNPSRKFMEIIGEWYLNHRTADQLFTIAIAAGFEPKHITIETEPENVNLFLNIELT